MSLSAIEIIDETVEFYENNSRSLNPTPKDAEYGCLYNGPNGEVCAFARCVLPEYRDKLEEGKNAYRHLVEKGYGDDMLMEQYRGHCYVFWNNLQNLHDSNEFWENRKLSPAGIEYVERFKQNPLNYVLQ
jgi:hypothetical protein